MPRIADEGYEAVGRAHGVSGNAVRKWVRSYERERVASAARVTAPAEATVRSDPSDEPGRRGA